MKKVLTIVLDGFGFRKEEHGNAIIDAEMSNFNKIWEEYPHSLLKASEEAVGLKEGIFGNSETGHQTIGAGRIIKQNETLIDEFLKNINLENSNIKELLKDKNKTVHLMGLCSDGGVHSNINQILSMYKFLVKNGFKKISFHVITDGRDTDIHSCLNFLLMIARAIKENKCGTIGTICGRYYAMDRDKNYDRTKKYYDLVTKGIGIKNHKIKTIIEEEYKRDITDEFIEPVVIDNNGLIQNGDILIWCNYREDRAKQIIDAFTNPLFDGFNTYDMSDLEVYSFLEIDKNIKTRYFIEKEDIKNPLGRYLSDLGLTQARIAETEKYAHVTFFFDGGYLGKIANCDMFHIPSPKVATYDLKPEMSAIEVTKKCVECMVKDYDFIFMNFANADMVGHTGNYEATVKACMALDVCLGKIVEKAEENFYKVIILADHGNADIMLDDNENIVTTHTLSKVPFIIMDKNVKLNDEGDLTMVAPTILEFMNIAIPEEMKSSGSLIEKISL